MTHVEPEEPWAVDRTGWGPGPWDDEPDKLNWITEAGLDGMAIRNFMGAWCGYVAVDETHPYFGKGPDSVDASVHGGLTYADQCGGHICHVPEPGRPDNVWWIGFDCLHGGDRAPGMEAAYARAGIEPPGLEMRKEFGWDYSYKTIAYVRNEVEDLARQLAAVG